MLNKIKILTITGSAGTGKDFLMTQLKTRLEAIPALGNKVNFVKAFTTRPLRNNETGQEYNFIYPFQFEALLQSDSILEYDLFNNWYYGTLLKDIDPNRVNIKIATPRGVKKLLSNNELILRSFLLLAPDGKRILRQINRETNPDMNEIFRRLKTDKEDFYGDEMKEIPFMTMCSYPDETIDENIETILEEIEDFACE